MPDLSSRKHGHRLREELREVHGTGPDKSNESGMFVR